MKPTAEQQAALEVFGTGESMVLEAGAGTGKTSTLRLLSGSTTDKGIYVAYNKSVQSEAQGTFPSNVSARTAHSLAFQQVGRRYMNRMDSPRPKPWDLTAWFEVGPLTLGHAHFTEYQVLRLVKEMVANFANSADAEIALHHRPYVESLKGFDEQGKPFDYHRDLAMELLEPAQQMWEDLLKTSGGKAEFTHDHYLKIWQLGDPVIGADFVLFDEAQDANPVIADVVARQDCQTVYVGDRAQAIYGWRGAIDAMETFDGAKLQLSQSFRFGPALAEEANHWLELLESDLVLTGSPNIKTVIERLESPQTVLCRTNAGAVERLMFALERGDDVHLVGGGKGMTEFCQAVVALQRDGGSKHRDLMGFEDWDQVKAHYREEGGELGTWVKILEKHTPRKVMEALRACVDEDEADLVLSTAHKAKGREWSTVAIGQDFERKRDEHGEPLSFTDADIMLRYVAVTRAQHQLDKGPL